MEELQLTHLKEVELPTITESLKLGQSHLPVSLLHITAVVRQVQVVELSLVLVKKVEFVQSTQV
jgi:hypothetical protein